MYIVYKDLYIHTYNHHYLAIYRIDLDLRMRRVIVVPKTAMADTA